MGDGRALGDIPTAHTPEGGWHGAMPAPVLAGCHEPLVEGAPDLRGLWRAVSAVGGDGVPLPDGHPVAHHEERVEQAGARVVVTSDGIIHDAVADGTVEHGVHDVMAVDITTPIVVVATYEDGALVLRPDGLPGVEVRRWREGEQMVWQYHTLFTVRMERVG